MAFNNIGFKHGSQTNLNTLISNGAAVEGCFYLTDDTQRLYIGKRIDEENVRPVPVNAGISFITSNQDLPSYSNDDQQDAHAGEFYYIIDTNILCVYSGTQWVQINNNTDTNTKITSVVTSIETDDENNTGDITITINDSDGQEHLDTFTIIGDNGILITQPDNKTKQIKISGDTYGISQSRPQDNTTDIELKISGENSSNDSSVIIEKGDNITLTPDSEDNTKFKIAAIDTTYNSLKLVTDESGTGFNVTMTDSNGATIGNVANDKINPEVGYISATGNSDTYTNVPFSNGVVQLPVYSKTVIDEKMQALNALTYKGTIGSDGSAADGFNESGWPIKNNEALVVCVGDTFLANTSITYNGTSYEKGSLFVALGEEVSGIITSNLHFDVIEESNDTDTTYSFYKGTVTDGASTTLQDSHGGTVGTLDVLGGTSIAVSQEGDIDNHSIVKIIHSNNYDTQNDPVGESISQVGGKSASLTAITGLNVNAQGHVTSIEKTTFTAIDTNAAMGSVETEVKNVTDNSANIETTVSLTLASGEASTENDTLNLNSSTLAFSSVANNSKALNIDLKWGSFDT